MRLFAALTCATLAATTRAWEVQLVFTREVRGAAYPVNKYSTQCKADDYAAQPCKCYGGAARRASFIGQPDVISIDTGSHFSGSGLFFPAFQGNGSGQLFASAGYNSWALTYRDLTAFAQLGSTDGGAARLAEYLAYVAALDPSLPPPVSTNINLTGTALEHRVAGHAIVPLPGGRRLAFLSAFSPLDLNAINPLLGARMSDIQQALQVEVARLHALDGGAPELVVAAISAPQDSMSEAEVQAAGSREAATDTFLQRLAEQVLGVDVFVIASDGLGKTELSTQTYTNWAGHQVLFLTLIVTLTPTLALTLHQLGGPSGAGRARRQLQAGRRHAACQREPRRQWRGPARHGGCRHRFGLQHR